jgi:hypothetical protein
MPDTNSIFTWLNWLPWGCILHQIMCKITFIQFCANKYVGQNIKIRTAMKLTKLTAGSWTLWTLDCTLACWHYVHSYDSVVTSWSWDACELGTDLTPVQVGILAAPSVAKVSSLETK